MASTSTPSAAPCSRCSARTGPASPRSSDHRRRLPGRRRELETTTARVHEVVDAASGPRPRRGRIIFQEFQDAATLTVAENISLGRMPNRHGFVDWRAVKPARRSILDQLQVDSTRTAIVGIAPRRRAPDRRDRASALGLGSPAHPRRADRRALAARGRGAVRLHPPAASEQGVAIIYITHRLDEVHGHRRPRAGAPRRHHVARRRRPGLRTGRRCRGDDRALAWPRSSARRRAPTASGAEPRSRGWCASLRSCLPGRLARRLSRARSWRSSASSAPAPPRSASRRSGSGRSTAAPSRSRASRDPSPGRQRRSPAASASSRRTGRRAARSWSARSPRTWQPRAGAACPRSDG